MSLRHAPFLGASSVFPQEILNNIVDQRHSDQQKTLLERSATAQAPFLPVRAQTSYPHKRTASTPVTTSERKRQRKNPAPQKSPAKPVATQSTPKPQKSQQHR